MANICHKKSAALLWTLLECVFFSGVVLGWSWLAIIFRSDGYFSCNVTISDRASLQLSADPAPGSGGTGRTSKNCRHLHSRSVGQPVPVNGSSLLTTHVSSMLSPTASFITEYAKTSSSPVSSVEGQRPGESQQALCVEQREMLRVLFAVVGVLRDLLVLPIGAFFDKYGTTRTRLLTVLVFAVGTLMTTFTTDSVPWLMVPALSLTGVAGTAVLLTNLQVANLFGRHRHLVVALYCGASLSSGLITYMMQLSHSQGVNVQTSFMFLTIGLVPMLVSTVAFLPKTRVPWPLPANYGKRRNQSLDENMLRKQRAWQRRLSAGVVKLRRPVPPFWPRTVQHQLLLAGGVAWHGVQALHTADMETRLVDIGHVTDGLHSDLDHVFGWLQLLSIALAPLPGLLIDRRRPPQLGVPPGTQQMQNIVPAIISTSFLAVFERLLSMFAAVSCQTSSFLLHALHRVFHLTTTFCFLVHVHFPQEHIGKYAGLTLAFSAVFAAFQFPIRINLHDRDQQPMPVHVLLLVLLMLTLCHALNVWICCRRRLIRDHPDRLSDRSHRPAASTSGDASLAVHIETDDSNMPPHYCRPQPRDDKDSDDEEDLELQCINRNGGIHVVITEPDPEAEANLDD